MWTTEDDAWLKDLRRDNRRILIKRLVQERLREGGYEGAPDPGWFTRKLPDLLDRVVTGVITGVVIAKILEKR